MKYSQHDDLEWGGGRLHYTLTEFPEHPTVTEIPLDVEKLKEVLQNHNESELEPLKKLVSKINEQTDLSFFLNRVGAAQRAYGETIGSFPNQQQDLCSLILSDKEKYRDLLDAGVLTLFRPETLIQAYLEETHKAEFFTDISPEILAALKEREKYSDDYEQPYVLQAVERSAVANAYGKISMEYREDHIALFALAKTLHPEADVLKLEGRGVRTGILGNINDVPLDHAFRRLELHSNPLILRFEALHPAVFREHKQWVRAEQQRNQEMAAILMKNATRFVQEYDLATRDENSWSDILQVTISEDFFHGKSSNPTITFTFQNGDEILICPDTPKEMKSWSKEEFDAYFAYEIADSIEQYDQACISKEITPSEECVKALLAANVHYDTGRDYLEIVPKENRNLDDRDHNDQENHEQDD